MMEVEWSKRSVLKDEHGLEERRAAHIAVRGEVFDEFFER